MANDLKRILSIVVDVKGREQIRDLSGKFTSLTKEERIAAEQLKEFYNVQAGGGKIILGTISGLRNHIALLKEQRDNATIGGARYNELNAKIREFSQSLREATSAQQGNVGSTNKLKQANQEHKQAEEGSINAINAKIKALMRERDAMNAQNPSFQKLNAQIREQQIQLAMKHLRL